MEKPCDCRICIKWYIDFTSWDDEMHHIAFGLGHEIHTKYLQLQDEYLPRCMQHTADRYNTANEYDARIRQLFHGLI